MPNPPAPSPCSDSLAGFGEEIPFLAMLPEKSLIPSPGAPLGALLEATTALLMPTVYLHSSSDRKLFSSPKS